MLRGQTVGISELGANFAAGVFEGMSHMSVVLIITLLIYGILYLYQQQQHASSQESFAPLHPGPIEIQPLLAGGHFPTTGHRGVSADSATHIWWKYPVFKNNYSQVTNNLKNVYNPDIGNCSPAEFCGAVYRDRENMPSNIVHPLPPVPEAPGARVGYFRAEV
jgi:hypothetical protein